MMKEERCNITAQIANLLMVYIVCLTVLFLGEYLLKRTPGVVPVLFLGVFLAYLFFLRSVVSNFIVYALLHIPPFVILIFIPWEMGKTELLLYAFVFTVLDFVHWIKRKKGTFAFVPIPLVLINALAYLYADVKKNTVGMIIFFALGILYFLLFYIRLFYSNAAALSKERLQDEKMPFRDILKNSAVAAFPFVILSILLMIFIRIDALDSVALAVYEFVVKIVVFAAKIVLRAMEFFAGLLFGGSTEETIREIGEMTDGEPGMVLKILSAIVYWSSFAVLLYLFVRLVISIIKWIPMKKSLTPEVIEESDMVEIRERIVKPKNEKEEKLSAVRRRYKTTVEKAAKKGYEIKRYHTPKERAKDLLLQKNEDIGELSSAYETERYSGRISG